MDCNWFPKMQPHLDAVLDTDAYNEIDDQYAIAYLLSAPERVTVQALYAAPFYNERAASPEDGMEQSYQEIQRILTLSGNADKIDRTYRGSTRYLPDDHTPVDSPAARDLAQRAMGYTPEHPLYVIAIGAITNVASALLLKPEICERIVLIWLGGHALHWAHTREFNMRQDYAAARVVFAMCKKMVQLPCLGVVHALTTTGPELNYWINGRSPLCDYLYATTVKEAERKFKGKPWSRVIWDVAAVAWLLDDEQTMTSGRWVHAPIPQDDGHYSFDPGRHLIWQVTYVNRDRIFEHLFKALVPGEDE